MPPVSPRKSSTSSGRRSDAPRPRYLGLEVAGEHFPPSSSRGWESLLRDRSHGTVPFRLIRTEGRRAIVEVGHHNLAEARAAWNGRAGDGPPITTERTWGTLLDAKAWLRASSMARSEP
jgi:hypothetical protein